MEIKRFEPIRTDTPYKQIYSRLGYVNGKTKLSDVQQEQTEKTISQAVDLVGLKGCACEVRIAEMDENKIVLENGIVFESCSLAKMLSGCKEVLLMAATAGQEIVNKIEAYSAGTADLSKAVVFDAVASEMADAALDWIVNFYNATLRRQNKTLTQRRFSAGYGDLDIKNQRAFYDILELDKLGISIKESYLLVPEKSVTAVSGIRTIT